MRRAVLLAGALALLALTRPSEAGPVVYTDLGDFEDAAGALEIEDFNDLSEVSFSSGDNEAGLLTINLSGSDLGFNGIRGSSHSLNIDGSKFYRGEAEDVTVPQIVFPEPVTAFGAEWTSTLSVSGLTITIGSDTINFSDHLTGGGDGFLGFVSKNEFSSVTFGVEGSTNEIFGMDDARFSNPMPEPGTLILCAAGAGGLLLRRRRKRGA